MLHVSKFENCRRLDEAKSEAAGRDGSEKAAEHVAGDSGTVSCTSSSAAHFTLGSNVSLNKLSHSHRLAGQDVILCRSKCQSHAHGALFFFFSVPLALMSSLARALFLSLLVSTHRPRPARQRRSTGSAEARLCRCTDWFNKGRMVRERERESRSWFLLRPHLQHCYSGCNLSHLPLPFSSPRLRLHANRFL